MAQVLAGEPLWRELRKQAEVSRQLDAAVAFIGKNPEKVLDWPKDCLLVTDVSRKRVKAGATSAGGVLKLFLRGVDVCSLPGLHAKVYVFDDVAFIGSANASESSTGLTEAAVKLTRRVEVAAARRLVRNWSRGAIPVDEPLLRGLREDEPTRLISDISYRPAIKNQPIFMDGAGVWIDAVCPAKASRETARARERIAKTLRDTRDVSPRRLLWTACDRKRYRTVPDEDWLFLWREPTRQSPYGRLQGPLRCLGGYDLGHKAGDDRYSRFGFGVRSKNIALTSKDMRLLASLTGGDNLGRTPDDARELHGLFSEEEPRQVKNRAQFKTLARLFA